MNESILFRSYDAVKFLSQRLSRWLSRYSLQTDARSDLVPEVEPPYGTSQVSRPKSAIRARSETFEISANAALRTIYASIMSTIDQVPSLDVESLLDSHLC